MHLMFRLPALTGVLLVAAAPFAEAGSPLPDPIAPAVIGRPLNQIRPARALAHKPTTAKPDRHPQVAAGNKVIPRAPEPVALAPAAVPQVPLAPVAPVAPVAPPVAKQTLAPTQVVGNVGNSTQFAGNPRSPGGYFSSKDQVLVRSYYQAHPASAQAPKWKIGDPIPQRAELTGVPDDLRSALSALPPGHQYVQLDGEVVLVTMQSRVVIDGISRSMR